MTAAQGDDCNVTETLFGFRDLDRLTGGLHDGDLIIIAARPVMGKTSFATAVSTDVAQRGLPVAYFSIEAGRNELLQRVISSQVEIERDKLRKGQLPKDEWSRVTALVQSLGDLPIRIDDTSALAASDLCAKLRRLHERSPVRLVVVDYLQLLRADDATQSRADQAESMYRSLKHLAQELNVPVLATAQLNRSVEERAPQIPELSDLHASLDASIENYADVICFIYRDDYYRRDESPRAGEADIIVAKNPHGLIGRVTLDFQKEFGKFSDLPGRRE